MEERECGKKMERNYREGWRRTSNTHAPLTTHHRSTRVAIEDNGDGIQGSLRVFLALYAEYCLQLLGCQTWHVCMAIVQLL